MVKANPNYNFRGDKMRVDDLCKLIASKEGKKSEVSIGNIREIVRIIRQLFKENPIELMQIFVK